MSTNSRKLANVLIVEDNSCDLLLIEAILANEKVNFNMFHVADGEEAIDFLNNTASFQEAPMPDLVFLDINMPKVNGMEVLKFIREDEAYANLPVCMLSSSESMQDKETAKALGASFYLNKPLNYKKILLATQEMDQFYCEQEENNIFLCCR